VSRRGTGSVGPPAAEVDDGSALVYHRKPGSSLVARSDEVSERVPYRLEAGIEMTAHRHICR
jgi:hypothetical protein